MPRPVHQFLLLSVLLLLPLACSPRGVLPASSNDNKLLSLSQAKEDHPMDVLRMELYDQTGLYISELDDLVNGLLLESGLTRPQQFLLMELRVQGVLSIVTAVTQDDVVYAAVEALFSSMLFEAVASREVGNHFPQAIASTIQTELEVMKNLFWNPSEATIGHWRGKIEDDVKQFLTAHPTLRSIGFAKSDLYAISDEDQKRKLYGIFGINSQIAQTTAGIDELNDAADRAIFLAQVMPQLTLWQAEIALLRLIAHLNLDSLKAIAHLPKQLEENITRLDAALEAQRTALTKSINDSTLKITASLDDVGPKLSRTIAQFDSDLAAHVDAISSTAEGIRSGLNEVRASNNALAESIAALNMTITSLPDTVAAEFENMQPALAESLDAISDDIIDDVILLLIGLVVSVVLASVVSSLLVLWIIRRR